MAVSRRDGKRLGEELHNRTKKREKQSRLSAPESTQTDSQPSTKDNRCIIVITNVENDFAKVHQEAIPRYCCLNEQRRCGSPHFFSSLAANGDKIAAAERRRRLCRYTVNARTETRSVEIAVYGKADGDVSSVFLPVRPKHGGKGGSDGKAGIAAGKRGEKGKNKATHAQGDDAVIECTSAPVGSDTFFPTLEEMVMTLRHKPYFTHPPKFLLNMPDKKDNEMLLEAKQCKRHRTNEDGGKQVSGEEPPVKKPRNQHDTEGTDGSEPQPVRQSSVRQADMITAVATTSARVGTRELQEQMKDIPGFVVCWFMRPQRFRVVFATKTALFKAKQLLDQFEVDGHMRVSLILSDGMTVEFNEHLASEENTA